MAIFDFLLINGGFALIANILTLGLLCVATITLWITVRSFSEHNRPYITFNIEKGDDQQHIYLIIRNNGIRGAIDVHISIDPPLTSYLDKSLNKERIFSDYYFPFIAPQQIIMNTFDFKIFRYLDDQDPDCDAFNICIKYRYKHAKYSEKYVIDMSYIKHIFGPADSDVKTALDAIHKDLEKIASSTSNIEKKWKPQ